MSPLLISSPFLSRQSDARLVDLARAGNDRAFEVLVKRYRSMLLAYARRLLGSDSRAEDALQQALLQAWVALRANAEPLEVKPWLFRIVHNASVNVIRRRQHDVVELKEAVDTATAGDSEARMAYKETLAHVAALPDLQRRAIVLTAFGGSSHEEAAQTLGLSDGAVRGLVHRARTSLRRAAAAFIPAPVAAWAAARLPRRAPLPERLTELAAGAGSAGTGGLLAKGGLLALTAGVVATAAHVGVPTPFSTAQHRSAAAASLTRAAHASESAQQARIAPVRSRGSAAIAVLDRGGPVNRVAVRRAGADSLADGRSTGERSRAGSSGRAVSKPGSSDRGISGQVSREPGRDGGSGTLGEPSRSGGDGGSGGGPGGNSGNGSGGTGGSGSGPSGSGPSGSGPSGSGPTGSETSGRDGGGGMHDGGTNGSGTGGSGTSGSGSGSGTSGSGTDGSGTSGSHDGIATVATDSGPDGGTLTGSSGSGDGSGGHGGTSGSDGGMATTATSTTGATTMTTTGSGSSPDGSGGGGGSGTSGG